MLRVSRSRGLTRGRFCCIQDAPLVSPGWYSGFQYIRSLVHSLLFLHSRYLQIVLFNSLFARPHRSYIHSNLTVHDFDLNSTIMFFNSRSLLKLAFTAASVLEANAVELKPCGTGHHPGAGSAQTAKCVPAPLGLHSVNSPNDLHNKMSARQTLPSVELKAISDPGVLLRGRSEKREMPGNGCFDPTKHSTFFWGGYGMYMQSSGQCQPNLP